jgi:CheY-like chemotaxis protein
MQRKIKILICEDETVIALDLKHTLIQMQFEVCAVVTKGEDMIKKFTEDCPDLIITDIKLKGKMDGIEAASVISESLRKVPILFLTGQSDELTYRQAMAVNPCNYLRKPFTEKSLHDAITLCLKDTGTELEI